MQMGAKNKLNNPTPRVRAIYQLHSEPQRFQRWSVVVCLRVSIRASFACRLCGARCVVVVGGPDITSVGAVCVMMWKRLGISLGVYCIREA